jgi:protein-disulfide isomerase
MRLFLLIAISVCVLAGQDWQSAQDLPGVDLSGLTPDQKSAALKVLREESCNCGCSMKIAECRFKDPQCSYSLGLSTEVVKDLKAGKSLDQIRVIVAEMAKQAPAQRKVLEDPVPLVTKGAPVRGQPNAKVTIVEFSDFQCPYCSIAAPKVLSLIDRFPNDVKVVFKQFPLDMHRSARLAAEASLAANAQGKFWEMHDKLFANYRQLSRENILKWASETGVDVARFTQELDSHKYAATVEKDLNEGTSAGVMGTPSFFIGGKRYNGPMDPEVLKPIIEAELKAARR